MVQIGNEWDELLGPEFEKPYYHELRRFLVEEYEQHTVYPAKENIFNALRYTPYRDVRVVILGQDPYHEPEQAHGLAFSVLPGVAPPPSLGNIFRELEDDTGLPAADRTDGCLIPWAKSGVLLLNTVLTVRAHEANSHRGHGWEILTDEIIRRLNDREEPVVFLLWGSPARRKLDLITNRRHMVLVGAHPSPLSAYRGFFGGKYFSRANAFLKEAGETPVCWDLDA